jgi:hypothetical protein
LKTEVDNNNLVRGLEETFPAGLKRRTVLDQPYVDCRLVAACVLLPGSMHGIRCRCRGRDVPTKLAAANTTNEQEHERPHRCGRRKPAAWGAICRCGLAASLAGVGAYGVLICGSRSSALRAHQATQNSLLGCTTTDLSEKFTGSHRHAARSIASFLSKVR